MQFLTYLSGPFPARIKMRHSFFHLVESQLRSSCRMCRSMCFRNAINAMKIKTYMVLLHFRLRKDSNIGRGSTEVSIVISKAFFDYTGSQKRFPRHTRSYDMRKYFVNIFAIRLSSNLKHENPESVPSLMFNINGFDTVFRMTGLISSLIVLQILLFAFALFIQKNHLFVWYVGVLINHFTIFQWMSFGGVLQLRKLSILYSKTMYTLLCSLQSSLWMIWSIHSQLRNHPRAF